ncbi:MAG: protein kinase [Planctomycetota bacterium]
MNSSTERTVFLEAVEIDDEGRRDQFLTDACGKDSDLRRRVDELLRASDSEDGFLEQPPVGLQSTLVTPKVEDEWIGDQIDQYTIMEKIGEGGFGFVFVANQDQPVRRHVALKIVKPGMGTKEVIARFEAERQAVAMMDHPNIAKIFDAGVTSDGRPYFVMELVRGLPITDFCDAQEMSIRNRVELFVDVCSAVQHAHQKAVIHRDLKPSNVMVTLHDDRAVVKVIDFGVAKAVGQKLGDQTIYTRFFALIGTPLYMSPEQAEMSGLDVDTRSDVYALGVMLYELLTGVTPFDRERLDSAGLDEMRRIIREEQPPSPSKRFSTLGDRATTVSQMRRAIPTKLTTSLRGDLDWIVMKALEKDRNRRYDSPADLAADLRRYLDQDPIEARPPSLLYRGRKFVRRHRIVLTTFGLVLVSLAAGLAASLWQMNVAIRERDANEQLVRQIERFADRVTNANDLIAGAQLLAATGQGDAARVQFDRAVEQQPDYYLPWVSRAQFLVSQNQFTAAAADLAKALQLNAPVDTPQWWGVPALLTLYGQETDVDRFYELYGKRMPTSVQDAAELNFPLEAIRNGVTRKGQLTTEQYRIFAAVAEQRLERPTQRGPMGPVARGPDSRRRPDPFDPAFSPAARPAPRTLALLIAGMAHLRAGDHSKAIRRLREAKNERRPGSLIADAALAVAYHHTGDTAAATKALREYREGVEQLPDRRDPRTPWFEDLERQVIFNEAIELTVSDP